MQSLHRHNRFQKFCTWSAGLPILLISWKCIEASLQVSTLKPSSVLNFLMVPSAATPLVPPYVISFLNIVPTVHIVFTCKYFWSCYIMLDLSHQKHFHCCLSLVSLTRVFKVTRTFNKGKATSSVSLLLNVNFTARYLSTVP